MTQRLPIQTREKPDSILMANRFEVAFLKDILNRIRQHQNFNSDIELAAELGVSKTTPNTWKTRNTIPYDLIMGWAERHHVSLDWLFFGIGQPDNYQSLHQETPPVETENAVESAQKRIDKINQVALNAGLQLSSKAFDNLFILDSEYHLSEEALLRILMLGDGR